MNTVFDQEAPDFRAEGDISLTTGGRVDGRRTSVDETGFGLW